MPSLEFCPKAIGGIFYCHNNKLIDVDMKKTYRFTELYKIHCEHEIIAEKSKLEGNIVNKDKESYNDITNRRLKV